MRQSVARPRTIHTPEKCRALRLGATGAANLDALDRGASGAVACRIVMRLPRAVAISQPGVGERHGDTDAESYRLHARPQSRRQWSRNQESKGGSANANAAARITGMMPHAAETRRSLRPAGAMPDDGSSARGSV